MSIEQEREELRRALHETRLNVFADGAEVPSLDMKIHHKRRIQTDYYDYDEWKIDYAVETHESMPIPAGQRVSAYLLIPRQQGLKAPFPAMISFHQCNIDCPLGKEAVVGKVSYRPDQAYGLELVTEGFVVLAPDSINCGERFIPSIRSEGEGKPCHAVIDGALGRDSWNKHNLDDVRAVDLLCSLDFVDSERIGAIGHSMGSVDAHNVLLYDSRVQACILSGISPNGFLPLHSPRLHIALQGAIDITLKDIEQVKVYYEHARRFYEADGAGENLVLRIHNCGHHFLDEFKWEAYTRLRQYFGMDEKREAVSLARVLKGAWERCWACADLEAFPEAQIPECTRVIANEVRLIDAFDALFIHLSAKSPGTPLVLDVKKNSNTITITYKIRSNIPQETATARVSHENYLRRAHQLFAMTHATMKQEVLSGALEYSVILPRSN